MATDLTTTNVLLAILATAGVVQAIVFMCAGVAALRAYRAFMALASGIEARQVAPVVAILTRILEDVRAMTSAMKHGTARVDDAVSSAVRGAEHVASHLQLGFQRRVGAIAGIGRGLRAAARVLRHLPASGPR